MEVTEIVPRPGAEAAPASQPRWKRSALNYRIPRRGANYTLLSIMLDTVFSLPVPLLLLHYAGIVYPAVWLIASVIISRIFTFHIFNLYTTDNQPRFLVESAMVSVATLCSVLMLLGILTLSGLLLPVLWVEAIAVTALLSHTGWRTIAYMWSYYRAVRRILAPVRVLIIGATEAGQEIASAISRFPLPTTHVVGYLADDRNVIHSDVPVIGHLDDNIFEIIRNHQIDEIILTTTRNDRTAHRVIVHLAHVPIAVRLVPNYLRLNAHLQADGLDQLPLVKLHQPALSTSQRLIKRLMDIILATLGLALVLPVFCLIALLIWLDDRGPVFFRQRRYGEQGKIFEMLKFRSMIVDADKMVDKITTIDEQGRTVYKSKNDSRITRIGRFIRKTSLDELPQLINILRGDMSLVGPRPEVCRIVETEYEPWQFARMRVPQGLTGWWQVTGRSENECYTDTGKDLDYIENYSLWLDIKIILMTIPALLKGKGAF